MLTSIETHITCEVPGESNFIYVHPYSVYASSEDSSEPEQLHRLV